MCNYIKKVQANLVEMIEQLAYREQQSDLKAFMRRESTFPTFPIPLSEDEEDKQTYDPKEDRDQTIMLKKDQNSRSGSDSMTFKEKKNESESELEIEEIYNDSIH